MAEQLLFIYMHYLLPFLLANETLVDHISTGWTLFQRVQSHRLGSAAMFVFFVVGLRSPSFPVQRKKRLQAGPTKCHLLCGGEGAERNGAGDYARHMMHV